MGGWFEDEHGEILRLGYNTAVDLKASQKILEQNQIPILIVSSELVKKYLLLIKDKEREVFLKSSYKTILGQAICEDMHAYWENKVPKKGELYIADMLTAYIGKHPEAVAHTQPIKINFSEKLLKIDMFHKDSKSVLRFLKVEESNIHLIKDLHQAPEIRMELILTLFPLFYPTVDLKIARNFLENEDNPEVIASHFNKIEANL